MHALHHLARHINGGALLKHQWLLQGKIDKNLQCRAVHAQLPHRRRTLNVSNCAGKYRIKFLEYSHSNTLHNRRHRTHCAGNTPVKNSCPKRVLCEKSSEPGRSAGLTDSESNIWRWGRVG